MSGSVNAFSLPPEQAIAFFRQKVVTPTLAWDDLRHGAHARAWSVAGVQSDAMLADIRIAMDRAIAEGRTLDQFRADIEPLLSDLGWADRGRGYVAWRTRTVYETNMRTAYAAGRYAELTDPDVLELRPWWRYRHSGKKDFRPQHKAWDGLVLRHDDPFWQAHFPPNGWGCGCFVQAVDDRAREAAVTEGKGKAPRDMPRIYVDPVTGDRSELPAGIDPGWDYSVGRSWLDGVVPPRLAEPLRPYTGTGRMPTGQQPAGLPPLPAPRPSIAPAPPAEAPSPEAAVDEFLATFGATRDRPAVFRDVQGTRIVISRDLFLAADGSLKADPQRFRYLGRLAEALRDPDEIWLDWAESRAGGVHVRRRYLRRFIGQAAALAVMEWTEAGWFGATLLAAGARTYLEKQRSGVLLFVRRSDEGQ